MIEWLQQCRVNFFRKLEFFYSWETLMNKWSTWNCFRLFFGSFTHRNLCDVWQLPNSRGKLDAMINYCYVIGSFRNKGRSVIGEFWDYLMFSKQRERNVVRVQTAVSLGQRCLTSKKRLRRRLENITTVHFLWSSCDMSLHGKRVVVASRWLLKSNDVLDAVLSTDLGEQRCFKFPIRQP